MINFPNSITLSRLFLAMGGFASMFLESWQGAFWWLLVAVLLDALDGIVARRFQQVSTIGIYLDIMVDKVVILSTYLIIGYQLNPLYFGIGLAMLLREYTIDTLRSIGAAIQVTIAPDRFSKAKGVLFMTAMLGTIGNHAFLRSPRLGQTIDVVAVATLVFAYATLIRVYAKYRTKLALPSPPRP